MQVQTTVLEALRAGVARQLAVLDDVSMTGTGRSAGEVLGIPARSVADSLTSHLIREIVIRGSRGGPLEPLAGQLNHDMTHLQGRRLEDMVGELADQLRAVLAQLGRADQPASDSGLEIRHALPPDTAAFTGRDVEVGRIAAAVAGGAGSGGVVAIHAIDGIPGVGKTALAVRAAHLLSSSFPDHQLFIDLHAHTPGRDPVPSAAALASLLTATGIDARNLPDDLESRSRLWRDRMAGQRSLLVLDNAASSSQVVPLLPGSGNCLVLITSRRHLGDLPGLTTPVLLDALAPEHAREMFMRLAPRAADDTATGVTELVRLAGFLPLAISLLARVYAKHPSWSLVDLVDETRQRLLTIAAENQTIAAAFDVSHRYLSDSQQQLFRRLGLHPGTTIDDWAAAALAGISRKDAAGLLDSLHGEGLLTETGYHRYGMHDLVRLYVRNHAEADPQSERSQALRRLLDYYQHAAALAGVRMASQPRPASALPTAFASAGEIPELPDRTTALAWARAERASLLACLDYAAAEEEPARVVALTSALAPLLRHDGPWADAITRHADAVLAARATDDRLGEAGALSDLGVVRRMTGDHSGAITALEEALSIYRALGSRLGEAGALSDLGVSRRMTGSYPEAEDALEQSLSIYRDLGEGLGQAYALSDLGAVRRMTGHHAEAITALEEALSIYRDLGDALGEAGTLSDLAVVRRMTGDYSAAAALLTQALSIFRDLGTRLGEANALNELGAVRRATGDYRGAAAALEAALGIFGELGARFGQASALLYLGVARRMSGEFRTAIAALEEARGIYRSLGSRLGEAAALLYLGAALRMTGDYPAAATALEEALNIYRDFGDRSGWVTALNEAGELHRARGSPQRARECHQQALEMAREITSSQDEAYALAGLGRCALAVGQVSEALTSLRQAQQIFQRIGAAEAAGVAAELDAVLTDKGPSA